MDVVRKEDPGTTADSAFAKKTSAPVEEVTSIGITRKNRPSFYSPDDDMVKCREHQGATYGA
jgi:hypothetical protein